MIAVEYFRWVAVAISIGIATHSGRVLFDAKYCIKLIHKVYKCSDEPTEKARLLRGRLAAAVVLVVSAYYGFTELITNLFG